MEVDWRFAELNLGRGRLCGGHVPRLLALISTNLLVLRTGVSFSQRFQLRSKFQRAYNFVLDEQWPTRLAATLLRSIFQQPRPHHGTHHLTNVGRAPNPLQDSCAPMSSNKPLPSAALPGEPTSRLQTRPKRGPCLARRTGQSGNVYQPAHPEGWAPKAACYGRFWVDVAGVGRQRRTVALGVCATKTLARKRLREHIESLGVNSTEAFHQNTAPAWTFAEQAEKWLADMRTRRRKPVKPATLVGWRHSLDRWILPNIGEVRLADVGNATLKSLIDKMTKAGLAPKSIITHSRVVKMVVASATNTEGEELYPRKWNHDFIGLPIVDPTTQNRPTVDKSEVERLIDEINPRFNTLVALLAGTGLRIGEALGLKIDDLQEGCRVLRVNRSVWQCQEQSPKTSNAIRVVDVPEVLAQVLRNYIKGKTGLLFATKQGKPLSQRNVLRSFHDAGATCGFHALRRFRAETLRRERVPEDLVRFWLGHASANVTDIYANGLRDDVSWRQEWAQRTGVGFSLVGLRGVTNVLSFAAVS
jgi:integrase